MNEILRKFTMGKPKQVVSPAAWIFIENFFISLPAILIYFVVTLLIEGFNNPSTLALDRLWMLTGAMGVFFVIQVVLCYFTFRKTYLPGARHSAENKKEFVRKLRTLPLGFFMNKKPGELINTFTGTSWPSSNPWSEASSAYSASPSAPSSHASSLSCSIRPWAWRSTFRCPSP